jgi:hypothetical protein
LEVSDSAIPALCWPKAWFLPMLLVMGFAVHYSSFCCSFWVNFSLRRFC